ncbi:MAG: insulinase family protein [Spirochaetes bacterium]|nr:insulinase family protein [Spirochaetota bacterium]
MILKKIKHVIVISFLLMICTSPVYLPASGAVLIEEIGLPAVDSLILDNGLRIFYIKDELPRYSISVSVGYGKLYETKQNAGISNLFAQTVSLSGSENYPGQKLHDSIEEVGGRINIYSSWEDTVITLQLLDKYYDLALDIIRDILINPAINPSMLERARQLLLEDIRRKQDSPDIIAFEKARNVIFNGDGYGAIPTAESIKSLSAKDMEKITADYFSAGNIIITMSGPVDFSAVKNSLKNKLSGIKNGKHIEYEVSNIEILKQLPEKSKNIYFLQKNIPQATVVTGTIAPDIHGKDNYALTLMNYILGGGSFTSRLMQEIRVKRGLAYGVQSVIRFRKNTGVFLAYAQTNTDSLDKTLELLVDNIRQMSETQIQDNELSLAKDSIRNSYIFEFATPVDILNQYIFINYNSLPESYLTNYVTKIESVNGNDIKESAQKLIKNGLITVVVGDKKLLKKLERFGKVVLIN